MPFHTRFLKQQSTLVSALALSAGAQGHKSGGTTTLPPGTLRSLIEVLRRTSLSRVEAHAGSDKLAAQRLRLSLSGTALQGLAVGLSLRREDGSEDAYSGSG